jgi:hypothetical protein
MFKPVTWGIILIFVLLAGSVLAQSFSQIPEFELRNVQHLGDDTISSDDLEGHVSIVVFWQFNRGSKFALRKLNELYTEFDDQGLKIVGIYLGTHTHVQTIPQDAMRNVVNVIRPQFPIGFSNLNLLSGFFECCYPSREIRTNPRCPQIFLINRQGGIIKHWNESIPQDGELEQLVGSNL